MPCSELDELLSAFADGQTVPAQTEFIESHLGACQRCQGMVRRYRQTRTIIQSAFDDRWTPPDLSLRVAHAYRRQQLTSRRPLWMAGIAAFCAAMIVLVAGLLATHALPQRGETAGSAPRSAPKLIARHGTRVPHAVHPTPVHCRLRFTDAVARCLGVSRQWVPTILADEPGILVSYHHMRKQPSTTQFPILSASAAKALKGGGARVGNGPSHRGSQAI
jgi:hypothetical protein